MHTHFPFQIPTTRGLRKFDDAGEMAVWLESEIDTYKGFAAATSFRNDEPLLSLRQVLQGVANALDNLRAAVSFSEQGNTQQADAHMQKASKQVFAAYLHRGVPFADSVEVQALQPFSEHDPGAALAALHCLCEPINPQQVVPLALHDVAHARGVGLSAIVRYQLFTSQGTDDLATRAIDRVIAQMHERADRSHEALSEQLGHAAELNEKLRDSVERGRDDYTNISEKLRVAIEERIMNAQTEIFAFKSSYQAEIALKEPVTFWQEKRKSHASASETYGRAALILGAMAAAAAVFFLPRLLKVEAGGPAPYYGIAVAVAVSTLILWLLRVLVRNYIAQRHLMSDADERVAMVKTYLALMESNKAPSETLGPVLAALFRPASDGLVKDDSMPMSVAELLTKTPR
jgi:hypothetical protein